MVAGSLRSEGGKVDGISSLVQLFGYDLIHRFLCMRRVACSDTFMRTNIETDGVETIDEHAYHLYTLSKSVKAA